MSPPLGPGMHWNGWGCPTPFSWAAPAAPPPSSSPQSGLTVTLKPLCQSLPTAFPTPPETPALDPLPFNCPQRPTQREAGMRRSARPERRWCTNVRRRGQDLFPAVGPLRPQEGTRWVHGTGVTARCAQAVAWVASESRFRGLWWLGTLRQHDVLQFHIDARVLQKAWARDCGGGAWKGRWVSG